MYSHGPLTPWKGLFWGCQPADLGHRTSTAKRSVADLKPDNGLVPTGGKVAGFQGWPLEVKTPYKWPYWMGNWSYDPYIIGVITPTHKWYIVVQVGAPSWGFRGKFGHTLKDMLNLSWQVRPVDHGREKLGPSASRFLTNHLTFNIAIDMYIFQMIPKRIPFPISPNLRVSAVLGWSQANRESWIEKSTNSWASS